MGCTVTPKAVSELRGTERRRFMPALGQFRSGFPLRGSYLELHWLALTQESEIYSGARLGVSDLAAQLLRRIDFIAVYRGDDIIGFQPTFGGWAIGENEIYHNAFSVPLEIPGIAEIGILSGRPNRDTEPGARTCLVQSVDWKLRARGWLVWRNRFPCASRGSTY